MSEAVAQEHEAEGTVWSFSFLTTGWRDVEVLLWKIL